MLSREAFRVRLPSRAISSLFLMGYSENNTGSVLDQILQNFVSIPLRNPIHNYDPNPSLFQCCSIGSWNFCLLLPLLHDGEADDSPLHSDGPPRSKH